MKPLCGDDEDGEAEFRIDYLNGCAFEEFRTVELEEPVAGVSLAKAG
jgi:hypothetical protein